MKYLRRELFLGSVLALTLLFSGCTTTQDQSQATPSSSSADISKSSDILISGALYSTSDGKKLVVLGADISAVKTVSKTAMTKTAQKVKNLFSGQGFVVSADVTNLPSNSANVANLPEKTKRIKFINDHQFFYLADTDEFDHARSLSLYDITTSKSTILYQAQAPWAIDEYVISPDQTIAALWEVQMSAGSKQLLGGQSKITQVDLKTKQFQTLLGPQQTQNLSGNQLITAQNILDPSVCVQYPLFYDSKNTLWLDTFCPNAGGLWGAGIYQVSATSKTLSEVNLLPAGSYSSDPTISRDGNSILVVRPPRSGDASSFGVEYAHANPAVLSVISVGALGEQKIHTPTGIYISNQPIISDDGKLAAYTAYANSDDAKNNKNGTLYVTNIATGETKSTSLTDASYPLVFARQNQAVLLGSPQNQPDDTTKTLITDAGNKYYPIFKSYTLFSTADLSQQEVVSSSSGEFIESRSATSSTPAVTALAATASTSSSNPSNMQIGAEEFRDGLADQRTAQQQSAPSSSAGGSAPGGPTKEECDAVLPGFSSVTSSAEFDALLKKNGWTPKNYESVSTPGTPERAKWLSPEGLHLKRCALSYKGNPACADTPSKCYDSPLYLYPQSQQKIEVTSGRSIFDPIPEPLGGRWSVDASPNGNLAVGQKKYDKISYSYSSGAKPMGTGIVTSQANFKPTLSDYADKLGLNQKEKSDFVSFWSAKLKDAPFVQISHYSRAQSAQIIKLDINPKPDTFISIVMYFKVLQFPTILPKPIFEPIQTRTGFTALDWSGIVEK